MTLYFEQHGQEISPRGGIPRLPSPPDGDAGITTPFQAYVPAGWEIQPPSPPAQRYALRWSAMIGGDDADMNDEPKIGLWPVVGWETQAVQPPAFRYALRHAGLLDPSDGKD